MKDISFIIAVIASVIMKFFSIGFILLGVRICIAGIILRRRLPEIEFQKLQMLTDGICFIMFGIITFFIARKILKEASKK